MNDEEVRRVHPLPDGEEQVACERPAPAPQAVGGEDSPRGQRRAAAPRARRGTPEAEEPVAVEHRAAFRMKAAAEAPAPAARGLDALDRERAASLTDEGGAAGAAVEGEARPSARSRGVLRARRTRSRPRSTTAARLPRFRRGCGSPLGTATRRSLGGDGADPKATPLGPCAAALAPAALQNAQPGPQAVDRQARQARPCDRRSSPSSTGTGATSRA